MARRAAPARTTFVAKKEMTAEEITNGINRLLKRIDELKAFDPRKMREQRPAELSGIETAIQTSLARVFGEGTEDYKRFLPAAELQWQHPPIFYSGMPETPISECINTVTYNIQRSTVQLNEAVRLLQEDLLEKAGPIEQEQSRKSEEAVSNKVFIVHGRDESSKNEVARFLSKIGLDEIILHERPNAGRHLLTKFQEESEGAGFAVVLITPDDEGGLAGAPTKKRARQNVVFELGFFIGRLGPSRVAALVKGDVEKPSDFDGVGYIDLDAAGAWKGLLARELKAARVPFDAEKVFEA